MSGSNPHQRLSIIHFPFFSRFKMLIQFMPLVALKSRIIYGTILLLTAAPLWVVTETIAPQIVRAYTVRVDLAVDRLPGDNFETLMRKAEAAARAATQRAFDQDILVTDVSVMVSVQNYGAIAPVLELAVSRTQWRNRPDAQRWATYFRASRELLYFGEKSTNNPATDNTQPAQSSPTPETSAPQPDIANPEAPSSQPNNTPAQPSENPQVIPVPTPPPSSR